MRMSRLLASTCLSLMPMPAKAQEAAHLHGVAHAQLVLDGNMLQIELQIPASDLVGFEHAPATSQQREKVAALQATWSAVERWLELDSAAGCSKHDVEVHLGTATHGEQDQHAHQDSEDGHHQHTAAHLDGRISASFECQLPERLVELNLNPFNLLPALDQVRYQSIWPTSQGAGTLDRENHAIKFSSD